jgi:glycosyltransferase involved in cell wall biosynthesis
MSRFIIYTPAYNAENTLSRTVESILNQTHTDFLYYLLDNASTDNTCAVINEYAKQDNRIIALHNAINWKGNWILDVIKDHSGSAYVCILDADDEYAPDFLEKMLAFMEKNDLDIAACGTDWIDGQTGKVIKRKVLIESLILEGSGFSKHFPIYRNFMTTVWGVVYSLDIMRKCSFEWPRGAVFSDTAFVMEAFHTADRAGILAESLHKYYIYPGSSSYKFRPDWFQGCKYLDEISRKYLLAHGPISHDNQKYLYVQLLILVKHILPKIMYADVPLEAKLESIKEIFTDGMTRHMLAHWEAVGIYSSRTEFLNETQQWILKNADSEELRTQAEAILSVIVK